MLKPFVCANVTAWKRNGGHAERQSQQKGRNTELGKEKNNTQTGGKYRWGLKENEMDTRSQRKRERLVY